MKTLRQEAIDRNRIDNSEVTPKELFESIIRNIDAKVDGTAVSAVAVVVLEDEKGNTQHVHYRANLSRIEEIGLHSLAAITCKQSWDNVPPKR